MSNISKYWDHKRFDFSLTNHELVKSALEKIKANKARGHDHIPLRALKASIPSITQPLSHVINAIISCKEVPNSRKRGDIVPHFKKDSWLEKVNYRPVTVLPSLSKIFEHILHQQLADHFDIYFISTCSGTGNITALLQHFSLLLNNGSKILTNTISSVRLPLIWARLLTVFHPSYLGETKILWPKWSCVIFNA